MTPALTILLAASVGWSSDGIGDPGWHAVVDSVVTELAADVGLSPSENEPAEGSDGSAFFLGAIERLVGHFHEPGIRARITYDPALPYFRDKL